MSRDPENGKPYIPATLHKYLYTGGNPVNRTDPRGSEDAGEYAGIVKKNLTQDEAYAAQQLRFLREEYTITRKILRAAIESLKQFNRGSFANNPDIWIDISNGNVYLEEAYDYEFLDNLDEYLP